MDWRIRRIGPDEGSRLRAIRLRALADAPSAFGSTLAGEEAESQAAWDERARSRCAGDESALFVAVDGDEWLGLAGGYRERGRPATVELVSMWVDPAYRKGGVGAGLVYTVVDWARLTGADTVDLWVTRGNEPASRLYRRIGFEPTADYQPLPSDPCREEERMRLTLVRA